ncbi:MAG: hypothetical protein MSS16_06175 [Streptococcus orisratti]|uniref:hypothetical protein n=1 Tax=Streptococcus orisratti TaxID=114652 RepID=UPI002354A537|nr:hypothetical protein [Streptococcus orisratti]MCI7677656.1 hypothetical protein [Streptococcus orisratti]
MILVLIIKQLMLVNNLYWLVGMAVGGVLYCYVGFHLLASRELDQFIKNESAFKIISMIGNTIFTICLSLFIASHLP